MNPQPDQLFREKLQHHQLPVPPTAWVRIEKNLARQRHILYWRVAAVILFLFTAAWIVLSVRISTQVVHPMVKEQSEFRKQLPATKQLLTDKLQHDAGLHPKNKATLKKNMSNPTTLTGIHVAEETPIPKADSDAKSQMISENAYDGQRGNTIIITLAEAQQFINSEIATAEATSESKKSSRLQKLVELATIISMDEGVFGQLRERKDELLVRNVRTTKNEQNN